MQQEDSIIWKSAIEQGSWMLIKTGIYMEDIDSNGM